MRVRLKYRDMIQFIKKASVSLMALTIALTASAGGGTKSNETSGFNWNPVMDAIIQVESEGNPKAFNKNGNCAGAMQITPILVKDCNNILKRQKSNKRYTMADRYSVEKSKEMFQIFQKCYNPENNIEKAIRLWNGGIKYTTRATNRYYKKVLAKMK